MYTACHIDKHYSKISDSREAMPDPMAGRGTFAMVKSLLPLQPHELDMFDMVDKPLYLWSDSVPVD